jgi:hypothetical protein
MCQDSAMRRLASVGWLLLVGCNRIFGIAATQPWDAGPDVIIDIPHVVLTQQVATTSSSGAPAAQLDYPPFATGLAPQVKIATLDGELATVTYHNDAAEPGWIEIPKPYFDHPAGSASPRTWRLEYTVPGGVPHEVQWAPEDTVGHLVVPVVGRLDRVPVPTGSGYTVSLGVNFSTPPTHNPRVFTTGLWSSGPTEPPVNIAVGQSSIDYDFGKAVSLSGTKGIPVAAQGDRGLVVDYVSDPDAKGIKCNVAVGAATLETLALSATGHTVQAGTWDMSRLAVTSDIPGVGAFARLGPALGALGAGASNVDSQLMFGVIPSSSFPGLIGTSDDFRLPVPVILPLLTCPAAPNEMGPPDTASIPRTAQPTLLADFPTALHVQLVEARTVAAPSITLYSGMETVIAAPAGGGFQLSFPASIPTKIKLTTPTAGTIDLVGGPDQAAIGAASGAFTLDFVPETTPGLRADYHDVYVHRIIATSQGNQLTTDRIYTVTAPQVRIDGSAFHIAGDYVLEIRSYAGHVAAPRGDFAPVDYPYGSAVVFTRTFRPS